MALEIIHRETRSLELNGHKIEAEIVVRYAFDDESVDGSFDFGDEAENAAYLAKFASGELYSLFVAVDALALGEQGRDSLGCCHVNSATAEKELLETMADHGMIEQACTDLIERIQGKATLLSRFAV